MNIFSFLFPKYIIDRSKKIRLISLFSGYDSQKLAFDYINVEVEHYKAIEIDKYAMQSLNEIHGTDFKCKDITKVSAEELNIVDTENITYIMTYSFPCTDLSLAGKKSGMSKDSGTRSSLLWEVERLLKETKEKPQILIMENVKQVMFNDSWNEFNIFLEKIGYNNYTQVLNSKDYGIPQDRDRVFMVSILGDYSYNFPQPIKLKDNMNNFLEKEVEKKYYLSDKMISYIFSKDNKYKVDEGHLQINREIACAITTREGCSRADTSNYIAREIDGKITDYRRLTAKERFKLMGVKTSDFEKITCSNTQKYIQVGNSIVTTCLMAIYSQLFENVDYKYYIEELLKELRLD